MKKLVISGLLAGVVATSSFGAGNVGCGLGYQIFGEPKGILSQIFVATTNGSSSNQFFGITSGTSGCSKASGLVDNDTHKFVNDNMDKLALDISQGSGESLETLAVLLKVEDKEAFTLKLQNNFDAVFTSENITSSELIENIFKVTA